MSMLDNSTASSAAASEPAAAPLVGIELQPEGAAEHLADASAEAALEHQSDTPTEYSPSAAAPSSALSASGVGEKATAAVPVSEPYAEQSAQKQRGRPFQPGQS